jgi:hypothetical protein
MGAYEIHFEKLYMNCSSIESFMLMNRVVDSTCTWCVKGSSMVALMRSLRPSTLSRRACKML